MSNKSLKVFVEQATRQAIINAYITGQINDSDLHMIIKKNNIKLFN